MDIPSNKEDKTNSVHLSGSAELLILRQKELYKHDQSDWRPIKDTYT